MKVRLGRAYRFFAAHRLHSPHLGQEENAAVYGKCNHPRGHGHTYSVRVVVEGPLDPATGMVMDLRILDQAAHAAIDRLAYRRLDQEVPEFTGDAPTSERLCEFLFREIAAQLPNGTSLQRVELAETRNNRFSTERTPA